MKISTSILSSNNREESIKKLNKTTSDYLHIDVMDGKFVNNRQFPLAEINKLIALSTKPVDIHLMVEYPEQYILELNNDKIEYITFHLEINNNVQDLIKIIHEKGYKVGLSIKPNTSINELKPYLDNIDMILVMSVDPGYGGQKFIPNTINKLKQLKQYNKLIEVDGGINNLTIKTLEQIADIAVVGSYIIKNDDYQKAINNLKY